MLVTFTAERWTSEFPLQSKKFRAKAASQNPKGRVPLRKAFSPLETGRISAKARSDPQPQSKTVSEDSKILSILVVPPVLDAFTAADYVTMTPEKLRSPEQTGLAPAQSSKAI
jgi:hypothetical protein